MTMVLWTGTGEVASSMRTKFNNFLSYFLEPGHRAKNVALLLASTTFTYSAGSLKTVAAGDIITTKHGGFAYEVVAVGSANFDLMTAGGVLLNLLPNDDGRFNFRGMNPAANGSTDDYPLLEKLLNKPFTANSCLEIKFPRGNYFMGSTIDLRRPWKLVGDGGHTSNISAKLIFAANTSGIAVNRFNTNVNGAGSFVGEADSAGIHGLVIASAGGTDRTKHGMVIRARCFVFNCFVRDFPGDGIHITAEPGGGGAVEGNASSWSLMNIVCESNRGNGLYVNGGGANAGTAINVDSRSNGRHGIWDSSFLGNTYVGCHVAVNGASLVGGNSAEQSSYVHFGGNRYIAHWNATEAQLVATQPGTNGAVWILEGPGGSWITVPTWTAGRPVGTYFQAFGYRADDPSNACVFLGCYSESGFAGDVFLGRCLVLGGTLGAVTYAGSPIGGGLGAVPGTRTFGTGNGNHRVSLTDGSGYLTWFGQNQLGETWRWKRTASGGILLDNADLGARQVLRVTGEADTIPWKLAVSDFINNGVREGVRSAAPTTEFWPTGSYVRNSNVSSGVPRGWRCTVGGTPGTWVADSNWP